MSTSPTRPNPKKFAVIRITMLSYLDTEIFKGVAESNPPFSSIDSEMVARERKAHPDDHEFHDYLDGMLSDEQYNQQEVRKWQRALAVIGLYHTIEVRRAAMLNAASGTTKDLHDMKAVKKCLGKLDIKHEDIKQGSEVDALRQIVNNIKHHGLKVGKKLAETSGFTKGQELTTSELDIYIHSEAAKQYLKDLAAKLKVKLT